MMSTHSSAACVSPDNLVPAASASYTPKGSYVTHGSTKCYITGPSSAKKAVFIIYDIFGFQPPTLQGADIIATTGEYLVIMPDFLDGEYMQPEWLAQDTDEKKLKMAEFMERVKDMSPHLHRIDDILAALREDYPGVNRWASLGFCWGGKLVSLTCGTDAQWSVGIASSPARIDPEDAKQASVPMMMLASKDEPVDAVTAFEVALSVPKVVETFGTQVHGWMSARANLEDGSCNREYRRGYGMVVDFLAKHL